MVKSLLSSLRATILAVGGTAPLLLLGCAPEKGGPAPRPRAASTEATRTDEIALQRAAERDPSGVREVSRTPRVQLHATIDGWRLKVVVERITSIQRETGAYGLRPGDLQGKRWTDFEREGISGVDVQVESAVGSETGRTDASGHAFVSLCSLASKLQGQTSRRLKVACAGAAEESLELTDDQLRVILEEEKRLEAGRQQAREQQGKCAAAKQAVLDRAFAIGSSDEAAVTGKLGKVDKVPRPDGDSLDYRSGVGQQSMRFVFDAAGLLKRVIELAENGADMAITRSSSARLASHRPSAT